MRRSSILALLGWLIAVVTVCASVVLLRELQDTRNIHRLETVRLPTRATRLPDAWAADTYRVLLVGDSRIAQWDALPVVPGVVIVKSGIGGETTGQLEDRFARDVLDLAPLPDEIILAAGINDLVAASVQTTRVEVIRERVPALLIERLQDMADLARARGIKVRIATIVQPAAPDLMRRLLFWDDSLFEMVRAANARIATLGHEVIDFNAILEGGDGPLPERFSVDTLHFNATAYETLGAALTEAIRPR